MSKKQNVIEQKRFQTFISFKCKITEQSLRVIYIIKSTVVTMYF